MLSSVSAQIAVPKCVEYKFRTERKKPKLGLLLVGWGGNNGSTTTAGIIANKLGMSWPTKNGEKKANYYGSLTQASTCRLGGHGPNCVDTYVPFSSLLPMVHPNDIVVGGWDISSMNLADAMKRAKVLDYTLQEQLRPHMRHMVPLPSIYYPDFIAANQTDRADNVIPGQDKKVRTGSRIAPPSSQPLRSASHSSQRSPPRLILNTSGRISESSSRRTGWTR